MNLKSMNAKSTLRDAVKGIRLLGCTALLVTTLLSAGGYAQISDVDAAAEAARNSSDASDFMQPNDFIEEEELASDFTVSSEMVSKQEATEATMVASFFSAVCAGIPALLLGIVIGLIIGRRKSSRSEEL